MTELNETARKIMDVAQEMTQTRGFSSFSYQDISKRIRIKTSSIHYYFPTKSDLALALLERYRQDFEGFFNQLDSDENNPKAKLKKYAELFVAVLTDGNRLCMGGMLAADVYTISDDVRTSLRRFFDDNQTWLNKVFEEGKQRNELKFLGKPGDAAAHFLSALEGAMLIAHAYNNPDYLKAVVKRSISQLTE